MASPDEDKPLTFNEMGLDDRLLKAIVKAGWKKPTAIQEAAIPLALAGRDVLCQARTGSGKTAVFAVPIIQKVLTHRKSHPKQAVRAVILAPTKELCAQIHATTVQLLSCCPTVKAVNIADTVPLDQQRPCLMEQPDIVVSTPSRIVAHLHVGNIKLFAENSLETSLQILAIDEGDLLFSFGYAEEMESIAHAIPPTIQSIVTSATLSSDLKNLKKLILNNPAIVKLAATTDEQFTLAPASQLSQWLIRCSQTEKFVTMVAFLKLKLVTGRTLIFCNSVDQCYRLKLLFEQFGIASCIMNSEMPLNVRLHAVHQFNDNVIDILIVSDNSTASVLPTVTSNKKQRKRPDDGFTRGMDFYLVANVINFDVPPNEIAYIHRVGRTARGMAQGTAITFVASKESETLASIEEKLEMKLRRYVFDEKEIDGFRYRVSDALPAITKTKIKELRIKEIRKEITNSQKLKSYFATHAKELKWLKHDQPMHVIAAQPELKHVPDYIVPQGLQKGGAKHHHNRNMKRRQAMDSDDDDEEERQMSDDNSDNDDDDTDKDDRKVQKNSHRDNEKNVTGAPAIMKQRSKRRSKFVKKRASDKRRKANADPLTMR